MVIDEEVTTQPLRFARNHCAHCPVRSKSVPPARSAAAAETTASTGEASTPAEAASAETAASPASAAARYPQPRTAMAAERGKADHHQSDNCCNRGDQQRAGEKPGCATDDSGADDRTSDVAEDRAQDRADRRNGDEQD